MRPNRLFGLRSQQHQIAEMRQVRPTARKPVGSWLTIKVSAEATADQGACKHGLGIALKHAGFTLSKIAFQRKSAFKVAVNSLHCDVQSVPQNGTLDYTTPLDLHIKMDGIFKPYTAVFERLAPELTNQVIGGILTKSVIPW